VTRIFTALAPAGVFYPLFAGLVVAGLILRWLVRRRVGGRRWDEAVRLSERSALTLLILLILAVAVLQIVLRNVFKTGLIWIEPLLRHLVLWIGFTAAVVATGRLRHIQMDVVGHLLPPAARRLVLRATTLAAALICAVLARAAWLYLGQEQAFGSTGPLGLPVWLLTCVIFLGFALMAKRFLARARAPADELAALAREVHAEAGLGGQEAREAGGAGPSAEATRDPGGEVHDA
jgi:C4-dicarboxylate transporter DctQ subunit